MSEATRVAFFRYTFAATLVAAIVLLLIFGRQGDPNTTVLVAILGGVVSALFTGQAMHETRTRTQDAIKDDVRDIANGLTAASHAKGVVDEKARADAESAANGGG